MIAGDFTPQARLAQHLKDVRLILENGRNVDAHLPLSELHRALLEQLVQRGLGDADNSAVIRAFDARP
jgi:3-hydroxyisobutyrate dehydrogenase-like beta-hydroxyacid dehydrogenase